MPITLQERTIKAAEVAQIKMVLEENNLSVTLAAIHLGMHQTKLSHMLNDSPKLRAWWQKAKADKKKRNARARRQRWIDKRAAEPWR